MYLLLNRSFELIMLTASTTIGFTYMQTLVYMLAEMCEIRNYVKFLVNVYSSI